MRHGTQSVLRGDMAAFDYGPRENAERYGGAAAPPSYRADFGLLAEAGVPVHWVAGGKE